MGKFNENSEIKELLEDERAVAIINEYLPGVLNNPMVNMVGGYKLKTAKAYAGMIGMDSKKADEMMDKLFRLE